MAYPYKKYNYILTIGGIRQGSFMEVFMKDTQINPVEYRGNTDVREICGKSLSKYTDVMLKQGMSENASFTSWIRQRGSDEIERRIITIQLISDDRISVLAQWKLLNAWPVSAAVNSVTDGRVTFYEDVEFTHEGLMRIK